MWLLIKLTQLYLDFFFSFQESFKTGEILHVILRFLNSQLQLLLWIHVKIYEHSGFILVHISPKQKYSNRLRIVYSDWIILTKMVFLKDSICIFVKNPFYSIYLKIYLSCCWISKRLDNIANFTEYLL